MKKKKMSKRELERIAEAEAKRKQQEEEAEKQRLRKLEKERQRKEAERAREKAMKELREHETRKRTLLESCQNFNQMKKDKLEKDIERREQRDWDLYLKCDGKPNPSILNAMNTYLFLWKLETDSNIIENTIVRCEEVLKLLDVLDELIDNPLDASDKMVDNWREVRHNFRTELHTRIDNATFTILRDLENEMVAVDLTTVRYMKECPHFILGLWTEMIHPRPWNYEPIAATINFKEIGVSVQVPQQLASEYFVIRVLWLRYNHYSDTSSMWNPKPLPSEYSKDLFTINYEEYEEKQKLKQRLDEILQIQKEKSKRKKKKDKEKECEPKENEGTTEENVPKEESADQQKTEEESSIAELSISPFEPLLTRSPSEILQANEEKRKNELKEHLKMDVPEKKINLRRHVILGGIYHVDFLEQPSQPKILSDHTILTLIHGEPCVHHLDFYEEYTPPPPKEEEDKPLHSADEPETETKPQEDGLSRLTLVDISLPDTVLWFEPPTAVQWRSDIKQWTNEYIYDSRFNEEKQVLTFRVGKMAPIGLATTRFINLPYQTWELRPDWKGAAGGVFLSITAATIIVEFIIRGNKVCLNSLQNANGNALQNIVGMYYEPHTLMRIMQRGGVDVFPQHDAYLYTEGITPKHWITENHIYQCMALMSTSYNFSWSRWNLLAGQKSIVMQIREFLDRKRLPNYSMLLSTPQRSLLVDCTEVSQAFSEQGVPGMDYYPDMYWLTQAHASNVSKEKMKNIDVTLVQTVYLVLSRTRVLSFS